MRVTDFLICPIKEKKGYYFSGTKILIIQKIAKYFLIAIYRFKIVMYLQKVIPRINGTTNLYNKIPHHLSQDLQKEKGH